MAYEDTIAALADPTRRSIFEALRGEPRSVGELAEGRAVSRPAVSQHLKVLERAQLVRSEAKGTRHYYSIRRDGLEALRDYLDAFWDEALDSYASEIKRRIKTN